MAERALERGNRVIELIGPEVVVALEGSAVVKAAVRSGGADQDAIVREVDSQRGAPRINEFAFVVQIVFSPDQDDDVLWVLAFQRFGNFGVAAHRRTLGHSVRGRIEWLGELGLLAVPVTLGMMISLGGVAAIPWLLAHWSRWTPHRQRIMGFVVIAVLYHWAISSFVGHQGERLRVPIIPLLALLLASGLGHLIRGTERLPLDPAAAFRLE